MIHVYFLGTELLAIAGYLLGMTLFPKRYPLVFYKFFAITVFSLGVWYTSLLTGNAWTVMILPVGVILLLLSLVFAYLFRNRVTIPEKSELMAFLGVEVLSYVLYLFLVYIRTFKPDILGTEKLMDVALINTIMKQSHIPIENPWLSGFFMNYYYFGHFILALFQYLFQVPTAVGYNLAISLIGVWIVQAVYLVAKAFRLNELPAFFVAIATTFGGNLYLLVQLLTNNKTNQWFAGATRVIPNTINEFPSYSVILGDLHGHYLSYPFFLLGIFLLIDIFLPYFTAKDKKRDEWIIPKSALLGILLGHLYLTNSWDILTLALLGGMFVAGYSWYVWYVKDQNWKTLIPWYLKIGLTVGLPVLLLSLPQFLSSRSYYLPPVGGIGINTRFSGLWELFMLFGQFLIIVVVAVALLYVLSKKLKRQEKMKKFLVPTYVLPALFLLIGVLLILIVEFFYAKDVFTSLNPPYARTNTVFKIYFHVWAFFSIGSFALMIQAFREAFSTVRRKKLLVIPYSVVVLVVAVMFSYPFIAIDQYIAPQFSPVAVKRVIEPHWSNGYSYMRDLYSPDYELVSHLLTKPFARILEVVTYNSYSYYARVSAYTGMSAVSGWPLHNVQWYGGYDGEGIEVGNHQLSPMLVANRITDIEKMYTSTDTAEVAGLLEKYTVDYVIFGNQEKTWAKDKTKTLNESVYQSLCLVEWRKDAATIYKCR